MNKCFTFKLGGRLEVGVEMMMSASRPQTWTRLTLTTSKRRLHSGVGLSPLILVTGDWVSS